MYYLVGFISNFDNFNEIRNFFFYMEIFFFHTRFGMMRNDNESSERLDTEIFNYLQVLEFPTR